MIWMKCSLVGLVAAVFTIVAIVMATTFWWVDTGAGSGGIGVISFGVSELLLFPATLAFALGFRWMFRRHHRRGLAS